MKEFPGAALRQRTNILEEQFAATDGAARQIGWTAAELSAAMMGLVDEFVAQAIASKNRESLLTATRADLLVEFFVARLHGSSGER